MSPTFRVRTLTRHPLRDQSASDQRAAIRAAGGSRRVPREIIRLECTCETMFGPQSVVECMRAEFSFGLAALMAAYCPHCKAVLTFTLQVDRLTGKRDTKPLRKRMIRGQAAIDRFLTRFPQCRGIVIQ